MPPEAPAREELARSDEYRADHSPWNWLLVVPIVVPLLTFLYDGMEPRLFGFPKFYWMQLAFIGMGVACTLVVHRMTRRAARTPRSGRASSDAGAASEARGERDGERGPR